MLNSLHSLNAIQEGHLFIIHTYVSWLFHRRQSHDYPHASEVITDDTHYNDVRMGMMASQITSLTIVYSIVYSGADQSKHQSSASLAFVRGNHRWPVNWPVTRKMFPFNGVIMGWNSTGSKPQQNKTRHRPFVISLAILCVIAGYQWNTGLCQWTVITELFIFV